MDKTNKFFKVPFLGSKFTISLLFISPQLDLRHSNTGRTFKHLLLDKIIKWNLSMKLDCSTIRHGYTSLSTTLK